MRADGGDWVYHDGVMVHEPHLDRGHIQVSSEGMMRDRLKSRATSRAVLIAGTMLLLVLLLGRDESRREWAMAALLSVGLVLAVGPWYMHNRVLAGRAAVPGIYERGVELIGRVFVPYEEIERTSRRRYVVWELLGLQLRGSGERVRLSDELYGPDGMRYVEARVRELAETGRKSPRP